MKRANERKVFTDLIAARKALYRANAGVGRASTQQVVAERQYEAARRQMDAAMTALHAHLDAAAK